MKKLNFTYFTRKITFLATASALTVTAASGTVSGNPSDPLRSNDFCATSCRVSGPCEAKEVQEQCQKICLSDWKSIARTQLQDNIGFKNSDENGKERLLSTAPIARCVLTENALETKSLKPALNNSGRNDLCAAALKKELTDFDNNHSFKLEALQPLSPDPLRKG